MNTNSELVHKRVTTAFISEEELEDILASYVMKDQEIMFDPNSVKYKVYISQKDSSLGFHFEAKVTIEEFK